MRADRVVVIGARRVRQGTGEFLARAFAESGAEVVAAVGTTDASVAEAISGLRERHGIHARGYVRLEDALERERPDIVVVASPYEAHRAQLEAVAAASAHCLCEKPLWWPSAGESMDADRVQAETERLADLFDARDRVLAVSTQWPMTLPAYFELHPEEPHPEARVEPIEDFFMELAPASTEPRAMVLDAASHPLSLLLSVHGSGRVDGVRASVKDDANAHLELEFDFVHETGTTRARVRLSHCPEPPRPAAFGFNGHIARREIRQPGYVQVLVRDAAAPKERREIVLEDPLRLLAGRFLATIDSGPVDGASRSERRALVDGMDGLARLVAAAAPIRSSLPDGSSDDRTTTQSQEDGERAKPS